VRRAAAAALAAAALLTGCAGSPPATSGPASDAADDALGGTLTVHAAASLQAAFDELLATFSAEHPEVDVQPAVYDGSSTLVAQLADGAPADVLATADEATMADLVATGLAASEPQVLATNTLVVAVPPGNPDGVADLADLAGLRHAVCAPEVPCGAATAALLAAAGVELDPVTLERNVAAVAERVARGDVDAGLVYATDVVAREELLDAVVPALAGTVVNRYPVVVLDGAQRAAEAFVELVLSPRGRSVLAAHGFGPPS